MPRQQEKLQLPQKSIKPKNHLPVNGFVDLDDFFIVSDDSLQQIKECSNDSAKLTSSVFCFSGTLGCIMQLIAIDMHNFITFSSLSILALILFSIGMSKYSQYNKSKKKISFLIDKIRRNKCIS